MTIGSRSGEFDGDGGDALRRQGDSYIDTSRFLGPGPRFLSVEISGLLFR